MSQPMPCLNHPDRLALETCTGCGHPRCDRCLVRVFGGSWCAACKEHRFQRLTGRRHLHGLAVASVITAAVGWLSGGLLIPLTAPLGLYFGRKARLDVLRGRAVEVKAGGSEQEVPLIGAELGLAGMVMAGVSFLSFLVGTAGAVLLRMGKI